MRHDGTLSVVEEDYFILPTLSATCFSLPPSIKGNCHCTSRIEAWLTVWSGGVWLLSSYHLCLVTPLLHPFNTPITPLSHPFTQPSHTALLHPSHPSHTPLLRPSYTLAYLRFVGHSSWANIKGKRYCDCYTRAPFTSWYVTLQLECYCNLGKDK